MAAYNYNPTGTTTNFGDFNPAVLALQQQLIANGANIKADGKYGPETQRAAHTADVKSTIASDPRFAGMDIKAITNAYDTGDWSSVTGPFSAADANKAFADSMSVLDPAYVQEKMKDTADLKDTLAQKTGDYQDYLDSSAANFQADKNAADTSAAQNGVLFSSGRVQNLNNLGNKYAAEAASKKRALGTDASSLSRDYQYKYGNDAAKDSNLSSFYNLGGNAYNPNVATGGVSSTGLSSIYNPSANDFYGTNKAKQSAEAKARAAGLLYAKGNKLVSNNYKNQY